MTPEELAEILDAPEGENLEFKEAKSTFGLDDTKKYCVALANEGGGRLILGVSDARPRRIVGTVVFQEFHRTAADIYQQLRIRVSIGECNHPDGRVLVFHVPSRLPGKAIEYRGAYLMRAGDSLVGMPAERLREIFAETELDFSAGICEAAGIDALSSEAVDRFRQYWYRKSGRKAIQSLSDEQLLHGRIEVRGRNRGARWFPADTGKEGV